jgi:Na+-translocating ferredoxin:NAD+ oxidoreductase RnfG subunit
MATLRQRVVMVLIALAGVTGAAAKQYLTIEEALKQIYPQADQFERKVELYGAADRAAIKEQTGVEVTVRGNRYWIAKAKDRVLGVVVMDFVMGKHELIDYAVGVSKDGAVTGIEILEYRESYGYEIRYDKWREQFAGKTRASRLRLNDDIDGITGATMSCRNVTDGVKRVLAIFERHIKTRL